MNNPIPYRILVVDDYEPWRRFVAASLQKRPVIQVVGEAENGLAAVQKATELKPDLVLLDIHLPDIDGIEVSTRIGQAIAGTKILFATQSNDPDLAKAALNDGAQGFLLKVDAASELLPAVKAVLRGEQFLSRSVKPKSLS
jgi:DNA-binding NarL/FixJ family response regulator